MTPSDPKHHGASAPVVYVLHENPEWIPPLAAAFESEGVPLVEWPLTGGAIDLAEPPPPGVYWSRLSASAHTRGHDAAKETARSLFRWLERHGRRVVNGSAVLELEVSKVGQYTELAAAGFDVPRTIAVFGTGDLAAQARRMPTPFITKHNQGGKGLGVRLFSSYEEFDQYLAGDEFEQPVDGVTLLQEYLVAASPFITRAEFAGGRFVYAVRVDTSAGSFELCPADFCAVPDQSSGAPTTQGFAAAACDVPGVGSPALFALRPEITAQHPLIQRYERFLADQGIEIAGIEFMETLDGRTVTYDINTNTNYNSDVEAVSAVSAPREVARFLGELLARQYGDVAVAARS